MQINRSKESGYSGYCKICAADISREWARTNPKKILKMQRSYSTRNRDVINAKRRKYLKQSLAKNRKAAIDILGGKCAICGFDDIRALEIDHINGGGQTDRKTRGARERYVAIAKGQTDGFQVLCSNCHSIKTREIYQ